jgi:PilZ domain
MAESPGVTAPSVLVIDDGELDRVQAVLERMSIDWLRCAEPDSGVALERPTDLIISSGPRSMRMPKLSGSAEPIWLCIYDQDFLPLRERLRDLGVHYLVSGELAPHGFGLFLRQLLNRGQDRRLVRRIPLHCDIQLVTRRDRRSARMLELSRESCVFTTTGALAAGERVSLRFPGEHPGDAAHELSGSVIRANGSAERVTVAVGFDPSHGNESAHLRELLAGNVLGTQVTPLREEPGAVWDVVSAESWIGPQFEDVRPDQVERRGAPRQVYQRRVEAVRWAGASEPQAWLARDLSITGLCVTAASPLPLRTQLGVALYGRTREEPLFVRAEVVRRDGEEMGLRFLNLSPAQAAALERLLAASPIVEDLAVASSARHVIELAR